MITNATAQPPCSPLWIRLPGRFTGYASSGTDTKSWLRFLRMIDQTVPADKQIYLICEQLLDHKLPRVQRWLDKHKRCHVRFTPTSAFRG